ncbi:unnamed protein product [Closterium sp. Naga37s-1]|nr:unnamed protein product [Closterium sp. Naga37s-1]
MLPCVLHGCFPMCPPSFPTPTRSLPPALTPNPSQPAFHSCSDRRPAPHRHLAHLPAAQLLPRARPCPAPTPASPLLPHPPHPCFHDSSQPPPPPPFPLAHSLLPPHPPPPTSTVHHYDAYRLGALHTATPMAAAAAAAPDIQRLDLAHSLATGTTTALLAPPALPHLAHSTFPHLILPHRIPFPYFLFHPPNSPLPFSLFTFSPPRQGYEPDVLQGGQPAAGAAGGAAEGRAESGEKTTGGDGGREGDRLGEEDGEEWEEQDDWEEEEEEGEWRVVHLDARGEGWTAVVDAVLATARLSPLVTIL